MKRSLHSLSHYRLLTTKMGQLTPIGLIEVLPGDSIQGATSLLVRCAPLNAPVMHPLVVRVHNWFIPWRLLWANFTSWITGGVTGADASVFPTMASMTPAVSSLADYLGLPTGTAITPSALPFRAYASVFNNFYADEDLVTPLGLVTTDGADATTNTTLQLVAWEKDYYTTARTFTSKGPAITLPLGTKANIKGIGKSTGAFGTASQGVTESDGTTPTYAHSAALSDTTWFGQGSAASSGIPQIYADLTNATAATVNQLRNNIALQQFEENRARFGGRYQEYLRYLGVPDQDMRLQLPEYISGGKNTIQFSEVLQQAPTTSGTPAVGVGLFGGHGIGATRTNRFRKYFNEHGYILSLLSVLPKTMYATGMEKHWSYSAKTDVWQKELEAVGQQAVLNQEVYIAQVGGGGPTGTFGYQDRYDQYRRMESKIAGLFRTTLNTWHLARIFAGDVTLNSSFVTSNPASRIFQDTSSDHLYVMANHSIQARRLVSKVGRPGLRIF